jgi:hypothetical protein
MNLADYLSELLGQYEEVSVPDLGYFVRERVNGYYNENESRFYPPYHRVKFVPQPKDDDTFTQYVADKKNISLASSKYFAEKFVSKLREQALTDKYLFADLGLFYTNNGQLVFKANDKITDDPAFYGYPIVNIYKLEPSLNDQYSKPSFAESSPAPVFIAAPVPAQPRENDLYFEEDAERKKRANIWIILLIIITVVALAIFGIYKFDPEAFDKIGAAYHRVTGKADTVVPVYRHEVAADSIKKTVPAPVKDTVIKTVAPVAPVVTAPDTVKAPRFEIIENNFKKQAAANAEVARLKAKNVQAKVLTKAEAPGPHIKVSAGTFPSEEQASAARMVLIKAGKIRKDAYIIEIKP